MLVVTSSAMATIATSQAAIASAEAHRAHVEWCKATMPNFDAKTATIAEMREYSGCVDALYPSELGADATIALKIMFVIALAGMTVGAWRERQNGLGDAAVMGLLGFLLAPCAVAFAGGVLYGIWWLLT